MPRRRWPDPICELSTGRYVQVYFKLSLLYLVQSLTFDSPLGRACTVRKGETEAFDLLLSRVPRHPLQLLRDSLHTLLEIPLLQFPVGRRGTRLPLLAQSLHPVICEQSVCS